MRDSHHLIGTIVIALGVIVPSALQASDKASSLASIERRVQATCEKVIPALVRITYGEKGQTDCSGVIVSSDGHVATCQHHRLPPGEAVTIHLPDGRTVSGKVLGSNRLWDIGMMQIDQDGPWPHAQFGKSADMKPGELCIALGYGGPETEPHDQPFVRLGRVVNASAAPGWLQTSCRLENGDSGGGLFDLEGRLIGVHTGMGAVTKANTRHPGIELFLENWDQLTAGKRLDMILYPVGLGDVEEAFWQAAGSVPAVAVEILGDGKRRALGTIVDMDGWILTKASELYGEISCRLADGRERPASIHKITREHDLAMLKVDAKGVPEVRWSTLQKLPVGTLVAALGCGRRPGTVGVVACEPRRAPRLSGWLLIGNVRESERGLIVTDDSAARKRDIPIRQGDVLTYVESRPIPDLKALVELTQRPGLGVPFVYAGDPIHVTVRRGKETLEFRFPLSLEDMPLEGESLRRSAFPSIFATDIILSPDACGGPVVDQSGQVVGVAIARATQHTTTYVIPAAVAQRVANELMSQPFK